MARLVMRKIIPTLLKHSHYIVLAVFALLLAQALHLSNVADHYLVQSNDFHQRTREIMKLNLVFQHGYGQGLNALGQGDSQLFHEALDIIASTLPQAEASSYLDPRFKDRLTSRIETVLTTLKSIDIDHVEGRQPLPEAKLKLAARRAKEIFGLLSLKDAENWTQTSIENQALDKRFKEAHYYMAIWAFFMVLVIMVLVSILRSRKKAELELQNANCALEKRVTERTEELCRANRTLEEQSYLLQTILNAIPSPIYYKDEKGFYLGCNLAFEEFLGRSKTQILGQTVHDVAPASLAAIAEQADKRLLEHRDIQVFETPVNFPDGSRHVVMFHKAVFTDEDEKPAGIVGSMLDITERKQAEKDIERLAYYDELTELPNRTFLTRRLEEQLVQKPGPNSRMGILLIDHYRFKTINETLGYHNGNQVLRVLAERISTYSPAEALVARVGGVRFAIMLPEIRDKSFAAQVAQTVLDEISRPVPLGNREIYCTANIGIALTAAEQIDADNLLAQADAAMHRAKEQGKGSYQFYSQQMQVEAMERLEFETSLRKALDKEQFFLHYQPQVNLETGQVIGVEALLRWKHPEKGVVSPAEFIPVLEETGLILQVGNWVLKSACAKNRAWQKLGLPPIRVSVNLSGLQLQQPGLVTQVARILQETELDSQWLELELTETIIMENTEQNILTLGGLKKLGVQLSIDDFGTGYSSLAYLKRFPIDKLKIDRSFVRDVVNRADEAAIAEAIIAMAHSLGLKVVAEGVETREQLEFLKARKCDKYQGFYFGKPMPDEELEGVLDRERRG